MKVTVIDRIMGAGKTTGMIEYLNNKDTDYKFMFVVPYLNECKRIEEQTNAIQPKGSNKSKELFKLLKSGKNVVITHQLFKQLKAAELNQIKYKYNLIIDEQIQVFNLIDDNVSLFDIQMLKDNDIIRIDKNRVIRTDKAYNGMYDKVLKKAVSGTLFIQDNKLYEMFNINIFKWFDEVFILTYLFKNQLLHAYFNYFGVDVEIKTDSNDSKVKAELRSLITIYHDKKGTKDNKNTNYLNDKNNQKELKSALSSTYLKNMDNQQFKKLKGNLRNYFNSTYQNNKGDLKQADSILWTTLTKVQKKLEGKGYINSFIPLNTKATNDYNQTHILAYVYNRFLNPMEKNFFISNNIEVDEDRFALSELIQWVWRSRIRNKEPINIYIPSKRMRELFIKWLMNMELIIPLVILIPLLTQIKAI